MKTKNINYWRKFRSKRILAVAAALALSMPVRGEAAPGQITGLQTTAGTGSVTLKWNGDSTGIGVWNIERSDQSIGPPRSLATPFRLLAQAGAGNRSGTFPFQFGDRGVQPGFRYCYRIQAQKVNGSRLPASTPVCINVQAATPPPALLKVLRPLGGQTLLVSQAIQIQWSPVPAAVRYAILFERTSPPATMIVPGGPFTGATATWHAAAHPAARGAGTIVVNGLNAQDQIVARGSVGVILADKPPGTGSGTKCSSTSELSFDAGAGRRFGWYTGSKTFTVRLTGGWKNRGIRFKIIPGDGVSQYTCSVRPKARMTGLSTMGYPDDFENGQIRSGGPVEVATDNIGTNAFFKKESGTIFLEVDWPQSAWKSCPVSHSLSCFYITMEALP